MRSSIMPLVQLADLRVERKGGFALDIPSLEIGRGEILSLLGPNGCGKTTLLLAIAGLLPRRSGEILFDGERLPRALFPLRCRRRIAMVFQESLLLDATVWDNVAMGLRFRGVGRNAMVDKVTENLERFRIAPLRDRPARALSGGEARRTSLARAFAVEPELLLLDEPFASLDLPSREALVEDLEEALRRTRTTAVLATHDRTEALRLSDRMAVMDAGRILQIGPPERVMDCPAGALVACFMGVENVSPGRVVARKEPRLVVSVAGHEIEALGELSVGTEVTVSLRPEKVILSPCDGHQDNDLPMRIQRIVPMGPYHRVYLSGPFPRVAIVSHRDMEEQRLRIGQVVRVSFEASKVHLSP